MVALRVRSLFRLTVLLLVVVSQLLLVTPVYAIANPDSISVESVKAYVGVWEAGDMLFVVEHRVMYTTEPTEDPSDAFLVGVWKSTVKGPDRPIIDYQHNFLSIYLTLAQVTSFGYVINDELKIRVMGNPSLFGTLTEGVNMRTYTLSAGNWLQGSSMTQTRQYLADWSIILAKVFEVSWTVTLLTSADKLNTTGKMIFEEAIPGLQSICPSIFQVSASYPEMPAAPGAKTFEATLKARAGTRLTTALEDLGEWITGKSGMGVLIGGLGVGLLYFILAGRIFISTGSVPIAVAVSIPFLFVGNLVGILPLTVTFIAAFLVVVTFGLTFILGRF